MQARGELPLESPRIEENLEDGIRVLCLIRGRGNALDLDTLEGLEHVFRPCEDAPPVLLSGSGSAFCTGLDLLECAALDRAGMARVMESFHRALCAVFLYPAPVVVALNGHTLAGGALLALAGDRRLMAEGESRFGIHGVHLGVSYPQVAVEILRHQVARPQREELLYAGHIFGVADAHASGLVDRPVPPEALRDAALQELAGIRRRGLAAYAENKRRLRSPAAARLQPMREELARRWLDQWFDPETRRRVGRARDALGGSGGRKPGA